MSAWTRDRGAEKLLTDAVSALSAAGGLPPGVARDLYNLKTGQPCEETYTDEQLNIIRALLETLTVADLDAAFENGFGVGLYSL